MTKSEIKKQLNSYTKKQLVEALSDILSLKIKKLFQFADDPFEVVDKIMIYRLGSFQGDSSGGGQPD